MLARLWLSTAVAAAVASGQLQSYRDFMACPDPVPAIVAHRANWHQLPENSVASIEDAIASGFDVVEIDVRRSADGQFFLLHDSTLDRTTETTGDPTTLTLAELTQIRLRNRDGGQDNDVTNHTIPSLEEVFSTTKGRIYIDLDVKNTADLPDVAALVRQQGVQDQVDIKMKVRNKEEAERLKGLEETYGLMVMPQMSFTEDNFEELFPLLDDMGSSVVELLSSSDDATVEVIENHRSDFDAAGVSGWVNVLPNQFDNMDNPDALEDPEGVFGRLVKSAGVRVIQTDEVEALASYRRNELANFEATCEPRGRTPGGAADHIRGNFLTLTLGAFSFKYVQ